MSQVLGTMYNQRDIVLVPFPYSDLSYTKKRPVLILSNDDYNNNFDDIVVCVITSNLYKDNYSITVKNENLEYGLMPEESCIKIHKLFTIHKSRVIKKFSKIDNNTFLNVVDKINKLFRDSE